jgi:hypothetical protein
MNAYEFTYESNDGHHAEAVEARDLDQARHYFHVTHPRGLARIINVVMQRTGREVVGRALVLAVV